MRGNVVYLNLYNKVHCSRPLYQYDYGQVLKFTGAQLPDMYEVHFSNTETGTAACTQIGNAAGVSIPDSLLLSGQPVYGWIYLHAGKTDGETGDAFVLPVIQRAKPNNEEPTPVQQDQLTELAAEMIGTIARANRSVAGIPGAIDTALTEAKESGEFDGPPGEDGTKIEVEKTIIYYPDTGITRNGAILTFIQPDGTTEEVTIQDGYTPQITFDEAVYAMTHPHMHRMHVKYDPNKPAKTITWYDGATFIPSVENGTLSWENDGGLPNPEPVEVKGDPGDPGADGTTFTPSVSESGDLSWTNDGGKPNPPTVNIKGPKGDDYVLTAQDKADIAAEVEVPVQDVQVNGTSILSNGVANVPIAGADVTGAVKTGDSMQVSASGFLNFKAVGASEVKAGTSYMRALTPERQHASAFYGLAKAAGDSTQSASSNAVGTYTESAKSAISDMLNAPVTVSGTTPTITAKSGIQYICGEVSTISITPPASGCCDVIFESGSTPAVLTVPSSVRWPAWFDPTSLEANAVYEINILNGTLGAVGVWA